MIQGSMLQNSSTRITPWRIILTLSLIIAGCGGGTGGLGEPVIVSPPSSDPNSPSYSITLAWEAPTANADGSTPLTDLAGYRVYYGTSPGVFTYESDFIPKTENKPEFTTPLLPRGTYYFAVKAFDIHENPSAYSSPEYGFCVNVDATPTPCPNL